MLLGKANCAFLKLLLLSTAYALFKISTTGVRTRVDSVENWLWSGALDNSTNQPACVYNFFIGRIRNHLIWGNDYSIEHCRYNRINSLHYLIPPFEAHFITVTKIFCLPRWNRLFIKKCQSILQKNTLWGIRYRRSVRDSVTRLGDFLHFGQLFQALGNN